MCEVNVRDRIENFGQWFWHHEYEVDSICPFRIQKYEVYIYMRKKLDYFWIKQTHIGLQ